MMSIVDCIRVRRGRREGGGESREEAEGVSAGGEEGRGEAVSDSGGWQIPKICI